MILNRLATPYALNPCLLLGEAIIWKQVAQSKAMSGNLI